MNDNLKRVFILLIIFSFLFLLPKEGLAQGCPEEPFSTLKECQAVCPAGCECQASGAAFAPPFFCVPSVTYFPQPEKPSEKIPWCAKAETLGIFGYLFCIFEYIFSLPLRIIFLLPAALGLVLAIVGGIACLFVQSSAALLINISNAGTINEIFNGMGDFSNIIRGFALSFIGIFLALIGLATILRIKEYEARKTLFPLIVAALLINFAPFFTDKIIEIGDGFTNFFIEKAGGINAISSFVTIGDISDALRNILGATWRIFIVNGEFFEGLFWKVEGKPLTPIIVSIGALTMVCIVTGVFFILLAIILGLLGIIFLLRIIFLLLLKIVAPIAFITIAFPTKEIKAIFPGPLNWEGWWTSLLEWAFMGVGLAFWLFLAINLVRVMPNIEIESLLTTSIQPVTISTSTFPVAVEIKPQVLAQLGANQDEEPVTIEIDKKTWESIKSVILPLLKYLAPLLALFIGVTTAPGMMGDFAKKAFSAATLVGETTLVAGGVLGMKWGGKAIKRVVPEKIKRATGRATERIRMRMEKYPEIGELLKKYEKVPIFGETIAGFGKMFEPGTLERELRERREKIEKPLKFLETKPDEILKIARESPTRSTEEQLKVAIAWTKLGEMKKIPTELNPEDIERIQNVKDWGGDIGKILKARPELAPHVGKEVKEVIAGMTPREFRRNVQSESLKNWEVFKEIDMPTAEEIMKRGTLSQRETLRDFVYDDENRKKIKEEIAKMERTGQEKEIDKANQMRKIADYIWRRGPPSSSPPP